MYKILIVEDDQSLLQALTLRLERENFKIISARDGEDGLEQAKNLHPDLILLDIIMPRMDGITMLKKLRTDEWGKKVSVIILTNLSDAEKEADAIEQGY